LRAIFTAPMRSRSTDTAMPCTGTFAAVTAGRMDCYMEKLSFSRVSYRPRRTPRKRGIKGCVVSNFELRKVASIRQDPVVRIYHDCFDLDLIRLGGFHLGSIYFSAFENMQIDLKSHSNYETSTMNTRRRKRKNQLESKIPPGKQYLFCHRTTFSKERRGSRFCKAIRPDLLLDKRELGSSH
jgi:hypothetical protein